MAHVSWEEDKKGSDLTFAYSLYLHNEEKPNTLEDSLALAGTVKLFTHVIIQLNPLWRPCLHISDKGESDKCMNLKYFINDYCILSSISVVRTWISQWFLAKNFFYFSRKISKINNHCKYIHHKSYLKPFLSYLPCIVQREYFSVIFNQKSVHYTW